MNTMLLDPAVEIIQRMINFVILSLGGLLVIAIGWIVAKMVRTVVSRLLKALRVDTLAEKSGFTRVLERGDIHYQLSDLIAVVIYWFIVMVSILVAANVMGLSVVANLLDKIVLYIPNVIAAIMVMVIGALLAVFMRKIVETAAGHAGLTHASGMGMLTHTIIMVFAVIMALDHLNIGNRIPAYVVMVAVSAIGLALALAFGLGCKDIAADALRTFLDKTKGKK